MSTGWQSELDQLPSRLNTLEGNGSADVNGIISETSNNVNQLALNTDSMLNAFTGNLSAYVFCHEDDLKAQVVAQLQFLVEDLKFWEQHKTHLT